MHCFIVLLLIRAFHMNLCQASVQDSSKGNQLFLKPTQAKAEVHSLKTRSTEHKVFEHYSFKHSNELAPNQSNLSLNWTQDVASTVSFGQKVVRPMRWINRATTTVGPAQQMHLFEFLSGTSYPFTGSFYRGSSPSQMSILSRQNELSNNISKILESLLQGYDKNQRPFQKAGEKTIITTNLHIRSMGPMSEKDMEYSLDCYFRQKWKDARLRYEGSFQSLSLNIHMLERIWKPDTFFYNGKGSYLHTITRPNKFLRINKGGEVYYSMRLTIKARCLMHFELFPMDKQQCPLIFGSYSYKANELVYVWDTEGSVSLTDDLVMSQFDLISYPCRNGTKQFRRGYYSMVQVNFNFIRHTGYFLIQIYFPCALIVVLSWVSFWINREATSDRVGLGMTSVLTLSTFGLDTRTDFPKVSYPTALDWFVIMCFSFVIATLLEFAAVHYFTKVGYGEHYMPVGQNVDTSAVLSQESLSAQTDEIDQQLREVRGELRTLIRRKQTPVKSRSVSNLQSSTSIPMYSGFSSISSRPTLVGRCQQNSNLNSSHCFLTNDRLTNSAVLDQNRNLRQWLNLHQMPIASISSNTFQPSSIKTGSQINSTNVFLPPTGTGNQGATASGDSDSLPDSQTSDFWFSGWQLPKPLLQCISCLLGSEDYKRLLRSRATGGSSHVNSVSTIDKFSRVMFPFSFILLNLLYWIFYFTERNSGFLTWEDGKPML